MVPVLLAVVGAMAVAADEYGDPEASLRVLIATESTAFKNRLVESVVERLDDGKTYIKVVNHLHRGLDGEMADEYDAVLITNSGVGSRVRPWVTQWLNTQSKGNDNIVLHTTRRDPGWSPKAPRNVDSITSPSSSPQVGSLAKELSKRVQALFSAG